MNKSIYLIPSISLMKKLLLSTLLIFTYCLSANAQCPPDDIITFSSQQELNNFAVNYPNCTQVNGSIHVGTGVPSNINDLSPLSQITVILTNLIIQNNPSLTNLNGLDNLFLIADDLAIEHNPMLTDISALSNVINISGLWIINNPALSSLAGLENVIALNAMNISDMPLLTDLPNLQIAQTINVLSIINTGVIDLSGLENVASINAVYIADNNELTDISGLEIVNNNEYSSLRIINNSNLSVCYVQSICNYIAEGADARIFDNLPGCNSTQEVQASCISLPVELTRFTAETQRGSVLLTWQTASETNNQGFDIQRSKDGINWQKIGWQDGVGNSTTTQNYRHNDTQPLSGINYYRLKQVDVEGDFIYTDVVNVLYESKGFSVFPVPAKNEITLQLESSKTTIEIRISNIVGEVIHTRELQVSEGVNHFTFDISEYTKGVYFLTINNDDKSGTKRFVKH